MNSGLALAAGKREGVVDILNPDVTVLWLWECRDPQRRSGWRRLVWRMTEDDAASWARNNQTERRGRGWPILQSRQIAGYCCLRSS